jgi:putative hydrolase of the HAD superfamily
LARAQGLPKAILFDMDDTILAYDNVADVVWAVVCNEFAARLDGVQPSALRTAIDQHRAWFWSDPERHRRGRLDLEFARREVVSGAFRRLGVEVPPVAEEIGLAYAKRREDAIEPFPGALETLGTMREKGVRLAIVTNGAAESQRRKIDRFGLEPYFDYVLIEGEFGAGKPEERVYMHALDQLDAGTDEAWMVGDNLEWEVAAPQRIGIFSIWMDGRRKGLPESTAVRPDRIINALPELL